MNCPLDGNVLEKVLLKDVRVDVCTRCHGVWLDRDEMGRLTHHFSYSKKEESGRYWRDGKL